MQRNLHCPTEVSVLYETTFLLCFESFVVLGIDWDTALSKRT
jgi:hypothetical protein